MALNSKLKEQYKLAYENLPPLPYRPIEIISDDISNEEWRDISPLYVLNVIPDRYQISSFGRIYDKQRNIYLSPQLADKGYLKISLQSIPYYTANGGIKHQITAKIHRLVMLHFKFRPDCYLLEIDHKNSIKSDNHIWNLEWVTPQENIHRAIENGLRPLSCTVDDGVLLPDEAAYNLYKEISDHFKKNLNLDIKYIADKYNIKIQYAIDLYRGSIRPYIANNRYNRFHYDNNLENNKKHEYYKY